MTNIILSNTGKKEAVINYSINNGYRATIVQIVNTGIEIEKDYFDSKNGFTTFKKAEKWALNILNPVNN